MAQPSAPPSYGEAVKEKEFYSGEPQGFQYNNTTTPPPVAYVPPQQGIVNPGYTYSAGRSVTFPWKCMSTPPL